MSRRGFPSALVVALCLAGCTLGPDYKPPEIALPDAFAPAPAAATEGAAPVDLTRWWEALHDTELDALVARAVQGNLDLQVALARLQEARTEEVVVLGQSLPSVDAAAGAAKGTGSDTTRGMVPPLLISGENGAGLTQVNEIGGFDAGWEIDLFGKFRREIEAARYDTEAAKAARDQVLIAVIGDTVRAYLDLRGLQTRLAILRQNLEIERHSTELVEARFNRGLINELDVTLARRELAALRSTEAPLDARIAAAEDTIAILLGAMPRTLTKELDPPRPIPSLPDAIAPGLPLQLLRRRPDIAEAERQLAAATARIGVATADLFPHLFLSGAVGGQGQGLGVSPNLVSSLWSIGPSAYWNILDFGALDALVEIADLRTQEQLAAYKRTVIGAVERVDDAIADFRAQQDRLGHLNEALTAAQRAVDLAQARYDRGLTDFLNVLDAERQQYQIEAQYAEAQQQGADDFAALYKALGGGWEPYQSIPPIREPEPAILAAFHRLFEADDGAAKP